MANCHGLDFFSLNGKLTSVKAADGVPAIPFLPDVESVNPVPIILHPIGLPLLFPSPFCTLSVFPVSGKPPLQNRSRQFQLRFYWKRKRRREGEWTTELSSFRPLLLVTDQRFPRGQKASVARRSMHEAKGERESFVLNSLTDHCPPSFPRARNRLYVFALKKADNSPAIDVG